MGRKLAKPNATMAAIAARQHGVVSLDQLRRLDLDEKAIRRRLDAAHLHRVHRGVYAVGHVGFSNEGSWLAAVLAVGRGPHLNERSVLGYWGAAVSYRSAVLLWGLLPVKAEPADAGPTDVIVPGNGGRARRTDIRVHRSLSLVTRDVTLCSGIPVTTPRRTISDMRQALSAGRPGAVSAWELRKAIRQANVLGLSIEERDRKDRTRSDLERDFLTLCRRHRLPRPEVNVRIGAYLADFLWREERLVVETDSYRYHRGEVAFHEDRVRDLELMRLGYHVLRLSETQIDDAPKDVAEVLRAELRRRIVSRER